VYKRLSCQTLDWIDTLGIYPAIAKHGQCTINTKLVMFSWSSRTLINLTDVSHTTKTVSILICVYLFNCVRSSFWCLSWSVSMFVIPGLKVDMSFCSFIILHTSYSSLKLGKFSSLVFLLSIKVVFESTHVLQMTIAGRLTEGLFCLLKLFLYTFPDYQLTLKRKKHVDLFSLYCKQETKEYSMNV